ncbi:hypothetical protein [Arthrobacter cupressi]|uniref:Uncharacterized protein n=1 Tax=Arthrobacter cupressi TaxID=1045773 RepID=A0A1G8LRR5_9MICC|nr:hypothetical protein [Arthrobacter cupressi]NYD77537.1 hypothetical protein [Arthrobacter cupressi]SDI58374.1 hypothetical protein SAMN05216555_103154 [Arthrobacter cupressi]
MHNVRELIRPSKEEWASLPRRRSGARVALMAWLLGLLTVGGAFVADRGWEEAPLSWEESLLTINVFGFAVTQTALLMVLAGWALGRYLPVSSAALLGACAVAHASAGAASATAWAAGAVLSATLAAAELVSSPRQLREIRKLSARLRDGRTTAVGENAFSAERRELAVGWWVAFGLACVSAALWAWFAADWTIARGQTPPSDGGPFAPYESVFALAATLLLAVFCGKAAHRWWVHRYARQFVWIVPGPSGPVWAQGLDPSYGGKLEPKESDAPGCTCDEETERRDPEYDESPVGYVLLDDYCAVHGIDTVNAMHHDAFLATARSAWLWDESSRVPQTKDDAIASSTGLLAFAGYAFGGIPVKRDAHGMDALDPHVSKAEELKQSDHDTPAWSEPKFLPPAEQGILDTIDLAPAGLSGTAVRYRHGRAWLRTDEQ